MTTEQFSPPKTEPVAPPWAADLTAYLSEVETYTKEAPRSQCFTRLLEKLPFVPQKFVSAYNRGIEASLSIEENGKVVRGEADALFGSVIVEFEKKLPAKSDGAKPSAKLAEAQQQLRQYAAMLWQQEPHHSRTRYIGIATDGVRFHTYTPQLSDPLAETVNVDDVSLTEIEVADWTKFSSEEIRHWIDRYFLRQEILAPTSARIVFDFGPRSHAFQTTGNELLALWRRICSQSEFAVVYDQWEKYLLIVYGSKVAADELFVRHTYLATLAKVIAWRRLTGATELPDPEQIHDLIEGGLFAKQGLENFIEEDFFSWLARGEALTEGIRVVRGLFSLMQKYDLSKLSEDVLKSLYQGLVDPETRHDLGEYYTPDWLAHEVVNDLLDAKPDAKLMDPTCGSGTFLYLAVREKRERMGVSKETLAHILSTVYGADIHPLAVIVAKTNYLLALDDLVQMREESITLPVYMADTLRLPEEYMQSGEYEIKLEGKEVFIDAALLKDSQIYDQAVGYCQEFAEAHIGSPLSPGTFNTFLVQKAFPLAADKNVQKSLFRLANVLKHFLEEKRDSIWAFVLRNLYKPLLLRGQFDALMGNPPWIAFRNTDPDYQDFLKRQITTEYRLEKRGHLMTHMEVATLFLLRASDLYLKRGGRVAFVLPRSLFQADQHNGLRQRTYKFSAQTSQTLVWHGLWDCEKVSPLFTVPSCVVFGEKVTLGTTQPGPIPGQVWSGQLNERNSSRETARKRLTVEDAEFKLYTNGPRSFWATEGNSSKTVSPYKDGFENGATLYPRSFWFVSVKNSTLGINIKAPYVETDPRATAEAKDAYKSIEIGGNVEARFLFASFLSADILPFAPVDYRLCVLPLKPERGSYSIVTPNEAEELGYTGLAKWIRKAENEWEVRRGLKATKLSLYGCVNYRQKLTMQNPQAKYRVIYPDVQRVAVATILAEPQVNFKIGKQTLKTAGVIVENAAYSYETDDLNEAQYLCAVLNSGVIDTRLASLRSRMQVGHPHVHKKIFDVAPIPRYDPANSSHLALTKLTQICAAKVQSWKLGGADGATDIGVLRRKARVVIAQELAEIDVHVASLFE